MPKISYFGQKRSKILDLVSRFLTTMQYAYKLANLIFRGFPYIYHMSIFLNTPPWQKVWHLKCVSMMAALFNNTCWLIFIYYDTLKSVNSLWPMTNMLSVFFSPKKSSVQSLTKVSFVIFLAPLFSANNQNVCPWLARGHFEFNPFVNKCSNFILWIGWIW